MSIGNNTRGKLAELDELYTLMAFFALNHQVERTAEFLGIGPSTVYRVRRKVKLNRSRN